MRNPLNQTEYMQTSSDLTYLILSNNTPSHALKQLLALTHLKHHDTLESVVEATQKTWLRSPHTERWQMENRFENLDSQIQPLIEQFGFLHQVSPLHKQYDYLLIFGDTVNSLRERLAFALALWRSGVRFTHMVFLVGQRPLWRDHEIPEDRESEIELFDHTNQFLPIRADWQEPSAIPKTETEMAKMVYDQAELPKDFIKLVTVQFVDTPLQPTIDGGTQRPNTGDTIKLWLTTTNPKGSCLAISSQPYIGYQHAVLKSYIPKDVSIETVGPKPTKPLSTDLVLDTLARWLYQENIFRKSIRCS